MQEQNSIRDTEANYADVLKQYTTRHEVRRPPVSQRRLEFELKRPQLLRECIAEAVGVFLYVFPGIASLASLILNSTSPSVTVFSSTTQVGLAFGFGIALAIIVAGPVSGGHFNPGMTLCFAIWGGFPWKKAPWFILSQILGASIAALLLVGCYWPQIQGLKAANIEKYGSAVFSGGAGGILCVYPLSTQTNLGYYVLQEFASSAILAMVTWGCIDPSNSPGSLAYTIGIAYAVILWGFGSQALSMNTARDLGTRIVNAIFFGPVAFTYLHFAWIPTLVNLPAFVLGAGFYEYVFRDSAKIVQMGYDSHKAGRQGMIMHLARAGMMDSNGNYPLETSLEGSNQRILVDVV